ncbi:MAG: hypothetical protein MUO29_11105, partial [Desulfobacterales bacterium]|nr:hypothetical protein [Desulfobacterales bacterium]
MDKPKRDACGVQAAGHYHEAYAVKQSVPSRRQFRTVRVTVKDRKEPDQHCRQTQFQPCFPEHGKPKENRRHSY